MLEKIREFIKTHKGNQNSLVIRFSIYAGFVFIVIAALFISVFYFGGAPKEVRNSNYQELKNIVSIRSANVITDLEKQQVNLENCQDDIEAEIDKLLKSGKYTNADKQVLHSAILQKSSHVLYDLLSSTDVTGVFFVLPEDVDEEFHQGLYLRKRADKTCLFIGEESLMDGLEYEKLPNYQTGFRIVDNSRCKYYNKIAKAVSEFEADEFVNEGYWSTAFVFMGDEEEVVTYTVPIFSADGSFYGVLGFGMDTQTWRAMLPSTELDSGVDNMYYLAYRSKTTEDVYSQILSSKSGKDVCESDGVINLKGQLVSSVYERVNGNSKYLTAVQKLDMPGSTLVSMDEEWMLIGVVNKKSCLNEYYKVLFYTILEFVVIIILMGVAYIYWAIKFSERIRIMAEDMRQCTPQDGWLIESTNVSELDEVLGICEEFFDKGKFASKLAEIIDMANLPMGAIEYARSEDYVFCMDQAANILEIHHKQPGVPYMKKKVFMAEMEVLKKSLEPYIDYETFHMVSRTGEDKWVRIRVNETGGRVLIAVLDITSEVLTRKKIEYERDYDVLTHLLNRMAFRRELDKMLKRKDLGVSACVMMDLDNLKYFNDTYGHDYGDKYICEAAKVLNTLNEHNALVARMSGDEFFMFLYGYKSKDEIRRLVKSTHNDLMESSVQVPSGENIKLRASAGIAWYPEDAGTMDGLIKCADFAMYESKNNMKGTISEFDRAHFEENEVVYSGSEELNRLIEIEGMVKYAFQPIIDAKTGEVYAYEALMRPQIDSLRSPADVIRLAKAQSKMYQIECVTWREALEAVNAQLKPGDKYKIFINSAPNYVLRGSDLATIVNDYKHLLSKVVIEIIENEQTDKNCMDEKFKWAEEYGMNIALDDFGAGYSNESTLLYINPKFVKIDMSMVMHIHEDENKQQIVKNLISYAKMKEIKVIAEGIECYEDMVTLIELGVDYLQGWYFAKPQMEIIDISEDLKKQVRECN